MPFNPEFLIIQGIQRMMIQMVVDVTRGVLEARSSEARAKADMDYAQAQFDFLKSQH